MEDVAGIFDLTRNLPNDIVIYRFLVINRRHEEFAMIQGKWLTIDELAEYLKMGRTKLYRLSQLGAIPASKVGNQWRFDREEIDQWMKRQRSSHFISNGE